MNKLRVTLIIAIVMIAVITVGFRFTQPQPETVAAAPGHAVAAPAKVEAISLQMTAVEPVALQPAMSMSLFEAANVDYRLSYPTNWDHLALSNAATLFQSPDGDTQVTVELAGPLPADGLNQFVSRSLTPNLRVYSHQLLTIHGLPAERVITFSGETGLQQTTFYISFDDSVVVITGRGEQQPIEMIARSFNAPQLVALK